jgi:hypothetical protein
MSRALLLLFMWGGAPADAPKQAPPLVPIGQGHGGETRCGSCHVSSSWSEVRFNHDKTGFPLRGQHAHVDCKSCHASDFKVPIARQCAACHFDAHSGDLGSRCEGCHDENSWMSAFDADAHRRTAFPLIGAHGLIPCQECHSQNRERKFDRTVVECSACHQKDLMRTLGTSIDHAVLGFTQQKCETCHNALSFKPAGFGTQHDHCFIISSGSHSAYSCEQCHDVIPRPGPMSCLSGGPSPPVSTPASPARCTACHEHKCGSAKLTSQHPNPSSIRFTCTDNLCNQCHLGEHGP